MKYVMFETENGRKFPVIFPDHLVHAAIAHYIANMSSRLHKEDAMPVSAGFVALGDDVKTSGESESLKMKSNEIDALRIMMGEAPAYMPDVTLEPLWQKLPKHKVKIPETVDEAKGMMIIGEAWLREHALNELPPEKAPEQYIIGNHTFEKVFRTTGLTNLSDLQAVLDQVERALTDG